MATVDETGLVTAKGDGVATITVTTTDEGFTDSIKVVVGPFLTITGDGVEKTAYFSLTELSNWETERPDDWVGPRVYSTINTWPTKKWYAAEGVKLTALLDEATIKGSARVIKVKATDGYVMTFTREELLNDTRYYFPNFKEDGVDGDGHIPGSPECKEPVDVIIALRKAEGSDNPNYMNPVECPLLVLGQRWVTEQTNHTFVKNVGEIEVSIDPPLKWAAPKAEPAGGEVPAGTEVKLTNEYNDADKIYYTTDGSDPSLESPIYNWVASRWWSQRGMDTVAEINHPIPLSEGTTTIKAKTIGFGREDSEIVTFTYKVIPKKTSESSEIKPDEGGTVSLDDEAVIEIPPGALTGTGAQEGKD
ncbi:MAG: chitobiase/beta-hexosaminidase C-terminal domain-containing protein [Dethiobacteria bacterium]